VCVPHDVARLWCVAERSTEGQDQGRLVVLERTGRGTFAVRWCHGDVRALANAPPPGPLRSLHVQVAVPELPATADRRWLTLCEVSGAELTEPLPIFCGTGLDTRVRIVTDTEPRVSVRRPRA
jgi:hypothetical protein